jgi:hypothetical protein
MATEFSGGKDNKTEFLHAKQWAARIPTVKLCVTDKFISIHKKISSKSIYVLM